MLNQMSNDCLLILRESCTLLAVHIAIQVVVTIIVVPIFVIVIGFLCTEGGQNEIRKYFSILLINIGVEIGWRGVARLLLICMVPAAGVALYKGYHDNYFDWKMFAIFLLVATFFSLIQNFITANTQFKRILSPGAGNTWRNDRKVQTASHIQAIQLLIEDRKLDKVSKVAKAMEILSELLNIIALHVKDHRGFSESSDTPVFASILIDEGGHLTVVCRDSLQWKKQYKRESFTKTPRDQKVCSVAIDSKEPKSVGCLKVEYPHGPQNKPYNSILALPILRIDGTAIGALSLDCSKSYVFSSFFAGKVENELENSLMPYIGLIKLVFSLIDDDKNNVTLLSSMLKAHGHIEAQLGKADREESK